jgi:SSS family solute:Na+ symporter
MNQGLLMRFMACKSVNEGRKAAAINILFVLPLSAIVVGNAGWLGKAISTLSPDIISPNTSPDEIFVVVASIVTSPGVFGFVMAALTAALMSTVDTLINATAAIFVNDVYRPLMKYFQKSHDDKKARDKAELFAARLTSIAITAAGVLSVLAFVQFPTVYEAHGYFHSTLTPPLVVAIFMGVFWKRFSPAGVITTFLGGVALMILGARYPEIFIAPFDHGIEMNPNRPYSYIRALYNLVVCIGVGFFVTYTSNLQNRFITWIRNTKNGQPIMLLISIFTTLAFFLLVFGITTFEFFFPVIVILFVPLIVTYFGHYDEELATNGLTVWSIAAAKAAFKGSTPNELVGEKVEVHFKLLDNDIDKVLFSKNDLSRMTAEVGDLVYLSDKRKWLGGLKSIHSEYGEPHDEEGIVYINRDHLDHGLFDEGRSLIAEKEM